ncbi:MAG TPA: peptidoglycan-associated lipoprotein Pal [Candidatus Binatia bacterium]|nr:peptidoglycan-associated lipoprotein Pal [Candidatus Binatia bacterium]
MRVQKRMLNYGLGLLAVTFLISCGNPANPPPPKWTAENPSAGSGTAAAQPAPSAAKAAPDSGSSLDALRSGESATGGPLKDIGFNFDSATLSESARATLKANADWLKSNPSARVQIEGHCDERGTADYNMALGAKRAQAAMDYLTTLGIAANRLSTVSYGEEIPVCKEHNEGCWVKNRRARFVVSQTKPTS